MSNAAKSFDYSSLSVLHSNFDDPTRLFSELYLVKFLDKCPAKILDFSAKPFFPCVFRFNENRFCLSVHYDSTNVLLRYFYNCALFLFYLCSFYYYYHFLLILSFAFILPRSDTSVISRLPFLYHCRLAPAMNSTNKQIERANVFISRAVSIRIIEKVTYD